MLLINEILLIRWTGLCHRKCCYELAPDLADRFCRAAAGIRSHVCIDRHQRSSRYPQTAVVPGGNQWKR